MQRQLITVQIGCQFLHLCTLQLSDRTIEVSGKDLRKDVRVHNTGTTSQSIYRADPCTLEYTVYSNTATLVNRRPCSMSSLPSPVRLPEEVTCVKRRSRPRWNDERLAGAGKSHHGGSCPKAPSQTLFAHVVLATLNKSSPRAPIDVDLPAPFFSPAVVVDIKEPVRSLRILLSST